MKPKATVTFLSLLLTVSLLGLITNFKTAASTPTTIQAAINNANPGDIVPVELGTYTENVIINKSITLKGSGQNTTFIRAADDGKAVIEIKINNANLTGFTIQGGLIGVSLSGYNASVIGENAIIENSNQGIYLQFSHNNHIANNTISLNKFEGIFLENSTNNLISQNIITRNTYVGVDLLYSSKNQISNNTISFHDNATLHDQGIWMESSGNNTIAGNIIANNAWGIDMLLSNNNTIVDNAVSGSPYRIALEKSNDNMVFHNNFFYSTDLVDISLSSNTWDNGTGGNYWSDYNGTDVDGDGIGDTYLPWHGVDSHPLLNPWHPPSDVTPPTTTDDYNGLWHNVTFTIHLKAVDEISGVRVTYYKINGASTINNVSANGQPIISGEAANNTVEYWSIDGLNNIETRHNLTSIKLDKTPPSGSIQINNGSAYALSHSVTLNLSANDSLSGVAQMRFSNDGANWTTWEAYNTTKTWNLTSPDGLKTMYAQYMDNASLVSQIYSDTITLDTVAPTLLILSPLEGSELRSSTVTIQWNATVTFFGVDHYEIKLDDGSFKNIGDQKTYTYTGLSDGTHAVTIRVVDVLGRTRETSVSFVVNTSPIGGPGYFEEGALMVAGAASILIIVYILRVRKRHRLKSTPAPNASAET